MTDRPDLEEVLERVDAWQNYATQMGVSGRDSTMATTFARRSEIGDGERWGLYEENALFARIIDVVPEHAIRRWISISGQNDDGSLDDDFGRAVLDAMDELQTQDVIYEALRLDRLDGGSVIVIGANDGQTPSAPLNLERIQSVDFFNVLTRYDIFPGPKEDNPASPDFRKPKYYSFTPGVIASGDTQIHPSRVIRFSGINASDRTFNNRDGWGLSIAPRIYDAVRRWGSLYSYVEAIFKSIVQGVFTMKDLVQILAADDGRQQIFTRLQSMQLMASSFNAIILDENEKYELRTMTVTGFSDLIMRCADELSAVSEIPLSILFGQPPSGLSTDDKSGRTAFYDMIANKQRRQLRSPMRRIIEALVSAKKGPTKGVVPTKWDFQFLPLEEPSEKEDSDKRLVDAQIDEKYFGLGVLTPEEIRARLANDPKSPYVIDMNAELPGDPNAPGGEDIRPQNPAKKDAPPVE